MMETKKVVINEELCKGCGLCAEACPKKLIKIDKERLNKKGCNPAIFTDGEKCVSCAFCAVMCPDAVIEVYK